MTISARTRLAEVLNADVIRYIVSLKPQLFSRLENPFFRGLMAKRISLGRVAAIADIPTREFLTRIGELAKVTVDFTQLDLPQSPESPPDWLEVSHEDTKTLDLLPLVETNIDLLPIVLREVKVLKPGETLRIRHEWEPQPLYDVWKKMNGLEWYAEERENEWWIWVHHNEKDLLLERRPS
jgi:uncharacterized protein (DUF2249 family)